VIASAGAAIGLAALLALVMNGPEIPLVLVHLVVLVLASGAAYLLDDRAAQVTAVVPRSLVRRRLGVVAGGFLVAAVGWGAVWLILDRAFGTGPPAGLAWEAAGVFWLGVAAAAVLSRRQPEPGNVVASTLGLLFIGALISRPLPHVTLLISDSNGSAHHGWWAAIMLASLATLVAASRDQSARVVGLMRQTVRRS